MAKFATHRVFLPNLNRDLQTIGFALVQSTEQQETGTEIEGFCYPQKLITEPIDFRYPDHISPFQPDIPCLQSR
jgi:hypothetical protein